MYVQCVDTATQRRERSSPGGFDSRNRHDHIRVAVITLMWLRHS